jgi:hypothetical protein
MPWWVKRVFLEILPRVLQMRRPTLEEQHRELGNSAPPPKKKESKASTTFSVKSRDRFASALFDQMDFLSPTYGAALGKSPDGGSFSSFQRENTPVRSAVESVCYIADHLKNAENDDQVSSGGLFVQ